MKAALPRVNDGVVQAREVVCGVARIDRIRRLPRDHGAPLEIQANNSGSEISCGVEPAVALTLLTGGVRRYTVDAGLELCSRDVG